MHLMCRVVEQKFEPSTLLLERRTPSTVERALELTSWGTVFLGTSGRPYGPLLNPANRESISD